MKWSFRVGKILGIDIRLHLVFLMLIAAFGVDGLVAGGLAAGLWSVVLALLIFGFVLLHELGHSLVARRYGVRVQDITLLPIGGVARLSHIPREPGAELAIAVSGPAVNLALAAVFLPLLFVAVALAGPAALKGETDSALLRPAAILWQVIEVNLILAFFNFVPAFPMDGGRILRAILARFLSYPVATRIAARVGRALVLAALGVGFALNHRWMRQHFPLTIVGLFIVIVGWHEEELVRRQYAAPVVLEPLEEPPVVLEPVDPPGTTAQEQAAAAFAQLAHRLDSVRRDNQLPG